MKGGASHTITATGEPFVDVWSEMDCNSAHASIMTSNQKIIGQPEEQVRIYYLVSFSRFLVLSLLASVVMDIQLYSFTSLSVCPSMVIEFETAKTRIFAPPAHPPAIGICRVPDLVFVQKIFLF